ncbi:MAG: hypothetical protein M0Z68_09510 [Gammaproteobacteria bacterium]|nr:hypothetical protein [Gammaproteobacteria bacterium]
MRRLKSFMALIAAHAVLYIQRRPALRAGILRWSHRLRVYGVLRTAYVTLPRYRKATAPYAEVAAQAGDLGAHAQYMYRLLQQNTDSQPRGDSCVS